MNEQLKIIISAEVGKLKKNVNDAKKTIKDFIKEGTKDFEALNEEFQKVGDISKKGLAVMGGAALGAATALLALGESTREYRQQQALLTTAFESAGGSAETAKETYNDLYRVLGDAGKATEASQQLAKLTTNQKHLTEWTNICQGVYATFGDTLPVEGLAEAVNHSAKLGEVQGTLADALEWSGVNVDTFNESLASCSTEAEREALIRETLNGLYSDASAKYEENNAQILAANEAQAKLDASLASIGETMEPINTMFRELGAEILADLEPYITEFAEKYLPDIKEALEGVGEKIGKVITWVADNWELISTLAIVIAAICAALSIFSTVMGIVNAVMLASPVTWIVLGIVAAIAAVVAIIVVCIKYWNEIKAAVSKAMKAIKEAVQKGIDAVVNFFKKVIDWVKDNWQGLLLLLVNPFAGAFKLLYDNCDGFRNFIDNFVAKVKEVIRKGFDWIKEKIVTPIKDAFSSVKNTFSNIVSTIGEKLNLAKDKVKEIIDKIKGFFKFEWSLPKLKVPKFSITPSGWKVGDLLDGVIPKLGVTWNARGGVFSKPTVFNYGNSLQGLGENGAEAVVPLENNLEWLNKLANMLSARMGNNQPIVLQVDGKTFAQISVDSINQLTRQQGKLQLNLV